MKYIAGSRSKILTLTILVVALAIVAIGCVETKPATDVTTDSAQLNGNLTNVAAGETVQVSFEYGTTTAYGNQSPSKTMTTTGLYSIEVDDLQANTTYHYRAKAVGAQTRYGANMAFTTPSAMTTADVVLSTDMSNRAAEYSVVFNLGSNGALTSGTDETILSFPSEIDLPSTINYNYVIVNGTPLTSSDIGISGQDMVITSPVSISGNGAVNITIWEAAGIKANLSKEPASTNGDGLRSEGYSIGVSTTQEPAVLQSNPYFVYNWVSGSPMAAALGDTIHVWGAGFNFGDVVSLSSAGGAAGSADVGSDGTFHIDAIATGLSSPILATDGTGRTAQTDTSVTVLPRLNVTPNSGNIGSNVTIHGYDFSGTPSISFDGISIPVLSYSQQDLDGDMMIDDFAVDSTVPLGLEGGTYVISAIDSITHRQANTTYNVVDQAITVDPASGLPGTTVTVTGSGWPPSASGDSAGKILFAYSPTHQTIIGDGSVETENLGTFTEICTIPLDASPGLTGVICAFGSAPQQSFGLGYFTVLETPILSFSSESYTVEESSGTATISVELSRECTETVTVVYNTSDGSASEFGDYLPQIGGLAFDPGDTIKTFDITVYDDMATEDDETIILTLTDPTNAVVGTPNPTALIISDDDAHSDMWSYAMLSLDGRIKINAGLENYNPRIYAEPDNNADIYANNGDIILNPYPILFFTYNTPLIQGNAITTGIIRDEENGITGSKIEGAQTLELLSTQKAAMDDAVAEWKNEALTIASDPAIIPDISIPNTDDAVAVSLLPIEPSLIPSPGTAAVHMPGGIITLNPLMPETWEFGGPIAFNDSLSINLETVDFYDSVFVDGNLNINSPDIRFHENAEGNNVLYVTGNLNINSMFASNFLCDIPVVVEGDIIISSAMAPVTATFGNEVTDITYVGGNLEFNSEPVGVIEGNFMGQVSIAGDINVNAAGIMGAIAINFKESIYVQGCLNADPISNNSSIVFGDESEDTCYFGGDVYINMLIGNGIVEFTGPFYANEDVYLGNGGAPVNVQFNDSFYAEGNVNLDASLPISVISFGDAQNDSNVFYCRGNLSIGNIVPESQVTFYDIAVSEGDVNFAEFNKENVTIHRMLISDGNITLSSEIYSPFTTTDNIPLIISTGLTTGIGNISFEGFADAAAVIYAPQGLISIAGGGNDIYGCLVGQDIDMTASSSLQFPANLRERAADLPAIIIE